MKNKIINLYNKEISALIATSTFITLIMWIAAKNFIEPSIMFTFKYVAHNILTDDNVRQMIKYWDISEPVNIQIIALFVGIQGFILTQTYIYTVTVISAYFAFKIVSSTIVLKNFKLKHGFGFINKITLVSVWVFLYGWINFLLQLFGLSDFWYTKLAILSQGCVFFFLIYNKCFGFHLQKRTTPIKY